MYYLEQDILIIIITSVFFGGIIKGTVGIGMSMFSVPIIAFFIPPTTSIMLLCCPVLITNVLQMQFLKGIGSYRFLPMFIFLVLGLIVGGKLILEIDYSSISQIMASLIIMSVTINFFGLNFIKIKPIFEKKITIVLGFFSGIIGGLSSMYAPLIIAYLVSVDLEKEFFIRTVATMYFIGSIILYPFFIYNGLGTMVDLLISSLLMIPALIGQYLGTKVRYKISNEIFRKITFLILFFIGISLLLKNI
jgi:uncharacterized membrane protein YfcA|tara:strand:- start:6 stop:749 length:744 start_codon:yes stop_codon:yes gene_type:complete